ncbi:head-tail connector protein [Methylocystis sp. JR02]|uniref:head-tail connector protein n=1 Tax=Methylocystis sp. JR02 TaxID=3046284 RepID=UPI0024BA802E|nr:head-tail connector protein [Methylocystis sp. JR02]MDJ0449241.1 head-tail connector protein [Methylocystis sp. JR02]
MNPTPRLRLVTDAASEPVTLADAKAYCRVDLAEDDTLITSLIKAARRHVEKETGLALLTQSWQAVYDRWPDTAPQGASTQWWDGVREGPLSALIPTGLIEIPKRPFQTVAKIELLDAYGTLNTVDPGIYFAEVSDMRGAIVRKLGQIWPVIVLSPRGAIQISFSAGFDAAPYSGVPDDLLTAVKILIKHWYDNREPASDGRLAKAPRHVDDILAYWRPRRLK